MAASQANLYIEQGATFSFSAQWKNVITDTPFNLTGCEIHMQVRKSQKSFMMLEASTENGKIVINDPAAGTFTVTFSAADTSMLTTRAGLYDIEVMFPTGEVFRILEGSVEVSPNITQVESDPAIGA